MWLRVNERSFKRRWNKEILRHEVREIGGVAHSPHIREPADHLMSSLLHRKKDIVYQNAYTVYITMPCLQVCQVSCQLLLLVPTGGSVGIVQCYFESVVDGDSRGGPESSFRVSNIEDNVRACNESINHRDRENCGNTNLHRHQRANWLCRCCRSWHHFPSPQWEVSLGC